MASGGPKLRSAQDGVLDRCLAQSRDELQAVLEAAIRQRPARNALHTGLKGLPLEILDDILRQMSSIFVRAIIEAMMAEKRPSPPSHVWWHLPGLRGLHALPSALRPVAVIRLASQELDGRVAPALSPETSPARAVEQFGHSEAFLAWHESDQA
jgi:hypothetical protein